VKQIGEASDRLPDQVVSNLHYDDTEKGIDPMECVPGKQYCQYKKNGKDIFTQKCECSLNSKGLPPGYCPIPSLYHIKENNHWLMKMWLGDTCHTYDRWNILA
jgi:hypothetical protein